MPIKCILVRIERSSHNMFKGQSLKKAQHFLNLYCIFDITENLEHFEKKDQLHIFNISAVIDSRKCGYFNVRMLLFENTFQESTC